jgi:hypothetical protein
MLKIFIKKRECGCIVRTFTGGTKTTDKGKMYVICGHMHLTICKKCQQDEENDHDTLYDMWMNDNITNDNEYAGWKEQK